jgi:flagellar basal body-associated protein FliL
MRRPTLIMIIVLFVLIAAAAVAQFAFVGGGGDPLPGPASPGQLPGTPTSVSPS